jgi:hypothetical protein
LLFWYYYCTWILFWDYYVAFWGLLLYLDSFLGLLLYLDSFLGLLRCFFGIVTVPGFFLGIATTPGPSFVLRLLLPPYFRDYIYPPILYHSYYMFQCLGSPRRERQLIQFPQSGLEAKNITNLLQFLTFCDVCYT